MCLRVRKRMSAISVVVIASSRSQEERLVNAGNMAKGKVMAAVTEIHIRHV